MILNNDIIVTVFFIINSVKMLKRNIDKGNKLSKAKKKRFDEIVNY